MRDNETCKSRLNESIECVNKRLLIIENRNQEPFGDLVKLAKVYESRLDVLDDIAIGIITLEELYNRYGGIVHLKYDNDVDFYSVVAPNGTESIDLIDVNDNVAYTKCIQSTISKLRECLAYYVEHQRGTIDGALQDNGSIMRNKIDEAFDNLPLSIKNSEDIHVIMSALTSVLE